MKERIKEFIDYKGISPGDLAVVLDVQRSNISHILNGRNKPGASFIEKFLNAYPEINARWLLTGNGAMIISGQEDTNHSSERNIAPALNIPSAQSESKSAIQASHQAKELSSLNQESNLKTIQQVVLLHKDGTFSTYKPA